MTDTNMVTISMSEYLSFKEDSEWLNCLRAAGIDSWDGIDYARELYNEEN